MNRKTLFALLTSLALILALAGPAATQDDTTQDDTAQDSSGTIIDVAAGNEDFSTLVAALQAAGLAETLSSEGPFTLFAPTNDAFAALPEGTLEGLLADPAGDLTDILLYHVVSGQMMAADLNEGMIARTASGVPVIISGSDGSLTINSANIVSTDIEAANGVIHVVDSVLLPPDIGRAAGAAAGAESTADGSTQGDTAQEDTAATGADADDAGADDTATDDAAADEPSAGAMAAGGSEAGTDDDADDTAGSGAMDDSSQGGPSTMPITGGNFGSSPLFIIVAGAGMAALAGSTWWSRRNHNRNHRQR